jgi:CubicO group peptidase (beta-lactamase class C family)
MVAAHLVSQYSNQTFPNFVAERILNPLNMSASTYFPSKAATTGRFSGAWGYNGRHIPVWFTDAEYELSSGAGGLISTAEDLSQWVKVLLGSQSPANSSSPIPSSVFDDIFQPYAVIPNAPVAPGFEVEDYGMGWERTDYRGHKVSVL